MLKRVARPLFSAANNRHTAPQYPDSIEHEVGLDAWPGSPPRTVVAQVETQRPSLFTRARLFVTGGMSRR